MIQSKGIFEFTIRCSNREQKRLKISNTTSVTWSDLLNYVNRSDTVTHYIHHEENSGARLKVYGETVIVNDSVSVPFHFFVPAALPVTSIWEGVEPTDNLDNKKGAIRFQQSDDPLEKKLALYDKFTYEEYVVEVGDSWIGTNKEDAKGYTPDGDTYWEVGDDIWIESIYTSDPANAFKIIGLEMQFKLNDYNDITINENDNNELNDSGEVYGSDKWIRGPYTVTSGGAPDVLPIEESELDGNDTLGDFSYTSIAEGYECTNLATRITGWSYNSFISDRSDNKIYHPRVIVFSNTANATEIFKYDSGTGALVMIDNALVILEKGSDFYESTGVLTHNSGISITDSDNITRVFNTIYNSINNDSDMWENGDSKVHVKDTGEINIEQDLMSASTDNGVWHVWFKFHTNGTVTDRQPVHVGSIDMTDIVSAWKPQDKLGWEFTW